MVGTDLWRRAVWILMSRVERSPQAEHVTPAGTRRGWLQSVATRPHRAMTCLTYETLVPAPLDAAFAFFSDASNLQQLTPGWVQFSIVTPLPIVMRAGLEIDYRIRLYGVPLAWTSRIDVWEPGRRFVDRQIAGPYLWWRISAYLVSRGRALHDIQSSVKEKGTADAIRNEDSRVPSALGCLRFESRRPFPFLSPMTEYREARVHVTRDKH